ncbi:MAG TPA: permease, partial [Egibacteraceae bacterium]|nr:permease [Egibacteraceae bacterium]
RNSANVAWRLGPLMLLATLLVGVVFTVVPPQTLSDRETLGIVTLVLAAAIGTLLQAPALFEIPLALGLLYLGLGLGPATALLLTAPAPGLITLAITRRELGWRPPTLLMGGTFVAGIVGGLATAAL